MVQSPAGPPGWDCISIVSREIGMHRSSGRRLPPVNTQNWGAYNGLFAAILQEAR